MISLNAKKEVLQSFHSATVDSSIFKSKIYDIPSSPLAEANCLEFGWFMLHLVDFEPL